MSKLILVKIQNQIQGNTESTENSPENTEKMHENWGARGMLIEWSFSVFSGLISVLSVFLFFLPRPKNQSNRTPAAAIIRAVRISGKPINAVGSSLSMRSNSAMPRPSLLALPAQS